MSYLDKDEALLRFDRQINLPSFDFDGQQSLSKAHVLIVGAGGLGCSAALYLAAAGIGKITIMDHDRIELSNLPRQIAFSDKDIGKYKADVLASKCAEANPHGEFKSHTEKFSAAYNQKVNAVLDCSDNFDTRYAANQYALENKIPLISGAAIRFNGQVTVINPTVESAPCYACLYPKGEFAEEENDCNSNGVIGPIVGLVGSFQALETIKIIAKVGTAAIGTLIYIDSLSGDIRKMNYKKDQTCSVCQHI